VPAAQDAARTDRPTEIGRPSAPRATSTSLEITPETGREAAGMGSAVFTRVVKPPRPWTVELEKKDPAHVGFRVVLANRLISK
jgi:hypothetical protein